VRTAGACVVMRLQLAVLQALHSCVSEVVRDNVMITLVVEQESRSVLSKRFKGELQRKRGEAEVVCARQ